MSPSPSECQRMCILYVTGRLRTPSRFNFHNVWPRARYVVLVARVHKRPSFATTDKDRQKGEIPDTSRSATVLLLSSLSLPPSLPLSLSLFLAGKRGSPARDGRLFPRRLSLP